MEDKNIEQLFNIAGYNKNTDDIDAVISDLEERIDYVFAKEKEAKEAKSAASGKKINKPFARKIQILTVLEQRAKVAGKLKQAQIAKKGKEAIRKKRGKSNG